MRKPKIVVSECLYGTKCRYDGQGYNDKVIQSLKDYVDIQTVCPELAIGLSIPRESIRIEMNKENEEYRLIDYNSKNDYTNQMTEFSEEFINGLDDIDGFILNPFVISTESVHADPFLKNTKIMEHELGFQTVMRRFLKGDEGMIHDVIYWLKHHSKEQGIFNYITDQNGFTLNDLVSYDAKHNEENGEHNQDGPNYNYSWNCGVEGPSRKKAVMELRNHQIFNAFFLLFLAQGTPCMLAGDEFGNSQKGNNNVYCQDNPIGWTDWRGLEKKKELHDFVKELIAFRKSHPILTPERELQGIDLSCCGVPDVSYHGEEAWQIPGEVSSRQLGVYYSGAQTKSEDCYVAYNMHWLEHVFALPALPKGYGWYVKATTERGMLDVPVLLKDQRKLELKERSVTVLTAERIVEVETKKNENITTLTDDQSS